MKSNKAFTLIELLVVVLIIGILAAIAVPQYQKVVLKANLHKGVSLVESIYQAQQAYLLAHGDFTRNLADLDISLPKDCVGGENAQTNEYVYTCDFGFIYKDGGAHNIYFIVSDNSIGYVKYLIDYHSSSNGVDFNKNHTYCFARPYKPTAISVCQNMGGTYIGELPNVWKYYALD